MFGVRATRTWSQHSFADNGCPCFSPISQKLWFLFNQLPLCFFALFHGRRRRRRLCCFKICEYMTVDVEFFLLRAAASTFSNLLLSNIFPAAPVLKPMDAIKPDSIVWVKLGALYGWWPAIFQPAGFIPEKREFPDLEILVRHVASVHLIPYAPYLARQFSKPHRSHNFEARKLKFGTNVVPWSMYKCINFQLIISDTSGTIYFLVMVPKKSCAHQYNEKFKNFATFVHLNCCVAFECGFAGA